MPLFIIGLYLGYAGEVGGDIGYAFMLMGILFYSLATFFQLVTLPVEFNASNRAMQALEGSRMMNGGELAASRRVLSAAAMTYVAALFSSLVSLLRLIAIAGGRRRN
jgi:Zn-dependent membrane protease YugP